MADITPKEKAFKLHKSVKTFILTCVGEDGYPLTKAVVASKHRDSLNEIYFCTNTSSKFTTAITANPKGSVYFYSRKLFIWKGCFLKGDFEIAEDMAVKQKFWNNLYKGAYEGKAYTCPDFCVLKFKPTAGRLYANFSIKDFEINNWG